jgi:hypothetical protein
VSCPIPYVQGELTEVRVEQMKFVEQQTDVTDLDFRRAAAN